MTAHIYPHYYKKFKCIASKCKHNCCIGWEIDIDENTLDLYNSVTGDFGKKLRDNISIDDTPHFVLSKNERCPFLNDRNLCDIIIEFDKNHICDICKEHPRFHNKLPQRVESGLGLCCEEASRLILSQKEKMTLVCDEEYTTDDEIIILRDKMLGILQNRDHDIAVRIKNMLEFCGATPTQKSTSQWCDILQNLEQLDKKWSKLLTLVKDNISSVNTDEFDKHMKQRQHEYEQFAVYILYRHFANAPDIFEAQKRAAFVAFAHRILYAIGATLYSINGSFGFEDQVEIARLFSSEIEYSDENLYTLFDIV